MAMSIYPGSVLLHCHRLNRRFDAVICKSDVLRLTAAGKRSEDAAREKPRPLGAVLYRILNGLG